MLLTRRTSEPAPESAKKFTILLLCTGNSARSIMAEALFNSVGASCFIACSAGSHPTGRVNPFALEQIRTIAPNLTARSKSWREFTGGGAPVFDFVMTVCGKAAGEACPRFLGSPHHIHWELEDPAAVAGDDNDKRRAFAACFDLLQRRINRLIDRMGRDMPPRQIGDLMQNLAPQHSDAYRGARP